MSLVQQMDSATLKEQPVSLGDNDTGEGIKIPQLLSHDHNDEWSTVGDLVPIIRWISPTFAPQWGH